MKETFDTKTTREQSEKVRSRERQQMDSGSQSEVDLTCLFPPNWINDEVIDKYLKLLNTQDSQVFMYTTYFHQSFSEGGFEKVTNYYRRYDILSYRTIFIPVHHGSHWFLITFDGERTCFI